MLLAEDVDHGRLHGALGPGIDRFRDLEEDEQERFRDALSRFVRIYSFLSQIVSFGDTDLERDYLFGKALQVFIKLDPGESVDLSGAVELTHLRHEQRFSGSVALEGSEGEVVTIFSGMGKRTEPEPEPLSVIIERLNAMHGTDWTDADRLVFDAALEDLVADEGVQVTAANNTAENFGWSSRRCSRPPCSGGWTATRRWSSSTSTTKTLRPMWPRSTPLSPKPGPRRPISSTARSGNSWTPVRRTHTWSSSRRCAPAPKPAR
ncbi:MAG: hypothetical protein H0W06_11835 [Chloroflexia bacterium]|nr:hypothetical protein [Chloroflexia bacterium]